MAQLAPGKAQTSGKQNVALAGVASEAVLKALYRHSHTGTQNEQRQHQGCNRWIGNLQAYPILAYPLFKQPLKLKHPRSYVSKKALSA